MGGSEKSRLNVETARSLFGAGRQRCPRQQEDENHSSSLATCHSQRRRTEQASRRRNHRSRRCVAQHSSCFAAKEDLQEGLSLKKNLLLNENGSFQSHPVVV